MTDDQAARAAIAADLSSTLFVEAGAGSGKTTQLVARILEILLTGRAGVDQLAAITFTEAAAGELRDRLAERLEQAAVADPVVSRRAAAADALAGLDGAAVTTLHGFARRILADHPFAAGLPAVFEVLDEVRSAIAFDDRWAGTVDALLADPDASAALPWLLACGAHLDDLRAIARAFDTNWDRIPPGDGGLPAALPRIDPDGVLDPLRRARALASTCSDPDDRLLRHLDALGPTVERLEDSDAEIDVLRVLAGTAAKLTAGNRGRPAAWRGRKSDVQSCLAEAQAARDRVVADAARCALGRVGVALAASARRAAAGRCREGRLDYHDLLVLARDVVRDDPAVQAALHDRYRFLLVDEFQDTDPIQAELAVRIAAVPADRSAEPVGPVGAPGGPAGDESWATLEVEPGRLFFVGDPKQSIYRFRRADLAVFAATRAGVADEALSLTANFRSVPGIVSWVDAAFGRLMADRGGPGYVSSHPVRPAHPASQPVVLVLGSEVPAAARADEARAAEAADVAAAVLAARDEGWPVGNGGRPATLADITVLVPTRRSVPALQEALDEAGIPYRLESSSLVYAAPEVQELLTVLRAIDDPTDEPAVVGALRSAGFGCGDDDLVRFRLAGGRWDFRRDPPGGLPPDDPVVAGLGALRAHYDARWWCDVSVLVDRVVEDRRLLLLALDGPRWREAWRRLRFVVDQARLFADASGGDLRRFLAWVDRQAADDARVTEAVLPEPDLDAVRIMTVHAAKGLEFPIVVVAGTGTARARPSGPGVLFGPDGPELATGGGLATPGYAALATREADLDDDEQVRLLYVAATRARDHLVVSVHRAERATGSLAARLAAVDPPWVPFRSSLPAGLRRPASSHRPGFAEPMATEDERAAWIDRRAERLDAPPRTVSATGVAGLADDEPGGPEQDGSEDASDRSVWRRGRAGTAVGRAVHATLQVVDLASGAGLDELARTHAAAEGIAGRADEVAGLVRAALAADVVRTAAAGRHWREVYVGTAVEGRVLEGFVDLLVDGPDGLEVVDYKTDQGTDEPSARYRLQGAAYAVAVESALGRPVRRCSFLFLRPDGAVAHRIDDLDGAKAEVRRLLASA
jgi:ATP-dependent helicase/nuclease subunit A